MIGTSLHEYTVVARSLMLHVHSWGFLYCSTVSADSVVYQAIQQVLPCPIQHQVVTRPNGNMQ